MSSTLFVEAFGQLHRDANQRGMILEEEEDLYSVFRERAHLMGWLTKPEGHPKLWAMEEAELTSENDAPQIGWAQVGLNVGASAPTIEPPEVLPALIQCFDDALRRFGVVDSSGYQVTARSPVAPVNDRRVNRYLGSVLNWFNLDSKASADAIVAFDQALLKDDDVSKLFAGLQRWTHGTFEFRSVVDVPEKCRVEATTSAFLHPVTAQTHQGVLVSLPEWTPSAVGWVLARVIDAARALESDTSSFAIRITRSSIVTWY